jgi:hypothetical protein
MDSKRQALEASLKVEPLKIQPMMQFEPEFKDDDEIRPYGSDVPRRKPYEKKYDTCVTKIINTIKRRADLGKLKYGTDLDRTDLKQADWINHAQEELMDAILYLEKLKTFLLNTGEANQVRANTEAGAGTGGSTHGGRIDIQDGEGGEGNEGNHANL